MDKAKEKCDECGGDLVPKGVLYSCPPIYQSYCYKCEIMFRVEGEGIKTISMDEAKKKYPGFYENEDLGEEIE